MTDTEQRPRKRAAARRPAVTAATILARLTAGGVPKGTSMYALSPAEWRIVVRALKLGDAYDTPRRGVVRFLADAYQGSGCVELASRDTRVPRFAVQIHGPAATALQHAIKGEPR